MTSSVVSDNFETSTGAIPTLGGDSVETRLCRAWVNFNGTGTVAIRASYNVSSITDNGTGQYTINFTTAMVDVNYATMMTMSDNAQANWTGVNYNPSFSEISPTTSAVRVATTLIGTGARDQKYVSVSIFR